MALVIAAVSQAQITLNLGQPLTSANQGNAGGAVYFNMTVTNTFTWTQFQYVSSDATPTTGISSAFNIYFGPSQWQGNVSANPGPWILIGTSTPVPVVGGVDEIVTGVISGAGPNTGNTVTFAPGTYGIALQAVGHSWGYQNGLFTFTDPNVSVTTGGASNLPFTLPTFSPRSVNGAMTYTLGGTPIAVASSQQYGAGCYANYHTFYEEMGNTATNQDLSNTSLFLALDTSGPNPVYNVTSGTVAMHPMGAGAITQTFADNNASVVISPLVPISYPKQGVLALANTVEMSADGFVSLDGTNAGGNPTVTNFLTGGARIGNWHDMDPLVGGTVSYEEDFTLGGSVFTWDMVPSRANADLKTFQDIAYCNGDMELRFGAMNLTVGGAWPTLVGYTPGNGSLDPGTRDVSATPYSTQGSDSNPLQLNVNNRPIVGTTVSLTTSDESTQPSVGVLFFSVTPLLANPFPLSVIGAPDCFAHVSSLDVSVAIDNFAPANMSVPFPVPNVPALVGQQLGGQTIWLDLAANNLGFTTSNGLLLKLGV